MLRPTSESEKFWEKQLEERKINVDEFISATILVKNLHENRPEVPEERLKLIWNRIENTKDKNDLKEYKIKRYRLFGYIAFACCIVGITIVSICNLTKIDNRFSFLSISDFASRNIIHSQQPTDKIQLTSGDKTLAVDGTQAKFEYDLNGKLKVNKKCLAFNRQTPSVKKAQQYNLLRVPYGKRAFVTLSDGSSLWVNTGTTVVYPTVFAKNKREIFVEGEVYAEVKHDAKRPFIIKTDKVDVGVLGTVFNITAYKEDKQTTVVLVSGLVNATPINGKTTLIKPNELFSCTNKACTLSTVDVDNYTSWHNGIYIFKEEPIENILLRLARYYNVTMILPRKTSGISCSGKLELKDNLRELLDGLSEISSISWSVKDNEYRVGF
jgi:hypothetical protein